MQPVVKELLKVLFEDWQDCLDKITNIDELQKFEIFYHNASELLLHYLNELQKKTTEVQNKRKSFRLCRVRKFIKHNVSSLNKNKVEAKNHLEKSFVIEEDILIEKLQRQIQEEKEFVMVEIRDKKKRWNENLNSRIVSLSADEMIKKVF